MKNIIILIFLITLSCSSNKVVKNHGLTSLEAKSSKIELSKSNKNDVMSIIGKPSIISLFDENIWFYIQRESVNQSIIKLGKSKIKKNNILEIVFNDRGIVKKKKFYNLENMNDLKVVKRTTEKNYSEQGSIGKMLKSIEQKVNSPKNKRTKK
tara:strand:+ start:280 stop:738 length:459 start_codon:yes stop_codon:yes gene_type:complete